MCLFKGELQGWKHPAYSYLHIIRGDSHVTPFYLHITLSYSHASRSYSHATQKYSQASIFSMKCSRFTCTIFQKGPITPRLKKQKRASKQSGRSFSSILIVAICCQPVNDCDTGACSDTCSTSFDHFFCSLCVTNATGSFYSDFWANCFSH